ncbi:XRE family transcriptional regulator [Ruegeria halocynthiae]
MFGANLRQLARKYPSVSELCRQLGINRTQFNRYLSGESFPRPDVLDRICQFFNVDARILLKPMDEIETSSHHPASQVIDRFLTTGTEEFLATGFYHAVETSPHKRNPVRNKLLFVRRIRHCTLLRCYDPRSQMPGQSAPAREVQGIVSCIGSQVFALMSRPGAQDCRMMVLTKQSEQAGQDWSGYIYHLAASSAQGTGVSRLKLRHFGHDLTAALRLRREVPHALDEVTPTVALT